MLSLAIWRLGLVLLAVILVRGFQAGILDKYPLFYIQVSFVLASFTLLYVRHRQPAGYAQVYWPLQFLTMLVASGVILEILRHALLPLARSRQCASLIRGVLFLAIVGFVLAYAVVNLRHFATEHVLVALERDFRTIEALLLLAMFGAVSYFRVSMGKNLKAMFLGYGIYVAASLVILAFQAYQGDRFNTKWFALQPLGYDIGLIIWAAGLWSYSPPAIPCVNMKLETNDRLASIIRCMASGS